MMRFGGVDAERAADVLGREHARRRFDHPIGVHFWQRDAFVQDARDLEPALQQLGEEFFTGDRIVAHVVVRLVVAAKWNRILDFVFCHHGRVRLSLEMGRSLIRVG